jgi:hypothetical protein
MRFTSPRGFRGRLPVAVAAILIGLSAARGQSYDCDRLRAQIAGAGQSRDSARAASEAAKVQGDIDKAAYYARSIGCENRQFLMFGSPPPPQCPGIQAQIQRMRANLAGLQARARGGDFGREALQARFDAACRGPRSGGLLESLFGDDRRQVPIDDYGSTGEERASGLDDLDQPRNGSQAVCVRTCDGGYFPVSYSARPSRYGALEELCRAQCPGAETAVYTMRPSGDIDTAVSLNGEPYSQMRNAGRFRKTFDPKCGCRPANKSWAEALAQAEDLLDKKSASDVIVTPEKADELSRPRAEGLNADKIRGILRGAKAPDPKKAGATAATQPTTKESVADAAPPGGKAATTDEKKVRVVGPKL